MDLGHLLLAALCVWLFGGWVNEVMYVQVKRLMQELVEQEESKRGMPFDTKNGG